MHEHTHSLVSTISTTFRRDLLEDHLAVFLRGDEQNPIMLANLAGRRRAVKINQWPRNG